MKFLNSKIYIAGVLVALVIAGLYFFLPKTKAPEITGNYHQSQFFEYAQFIESSVEQAKNDEKIDLDLVLGGIVPHHVPTTIPLLAEFYTKLKNTREVKTFIILGPDHVDRGRGQINVSKAAFVTPFIEIKPDLEIIEKLENSGFVTYDETPFDREHSIDSQLLLISKIFPEARVVPLVFRSNINNKTARAFGEILAEIAGEDVFVVGSVDFSHYLSEEQARPLDYLSANVLGAVTSQFGGLVEADSTQALVALMTFLEKRGANHRVDLQNFNTGDFSSNRDFTTGYVSGFWGIKNNLLNMRDSEANLIFVGDIMLSRMIGDIMARKNDWKYPFLKIADFLRRADLTIGNLEGPISSRGVNQGSIYSFRADPKAVEGLLYSGFDVLSIANNHILDWGRVALADTVDILTEMRIATVGAGRNFEEANRPHITEVRGTKIAFFAYTNLYPESLWATETQGGVSMPILENIKESISKVRNEVDTIILLWHWGEEYQTKFHLREQKLAHTLIDAGADIIVGHHPHVVQETEEYNGGYIAYSLGNFVFDQNFSEDTRRGLTLKITLRNGKIFKTEKLEVRFNSDFQPFLRNPPPPPSGERVKMEGF